MKVLALTTYPSADASRRLRFDPLIAELAKSDEVRVHALMTDSAFRVKNQAFGRFWSATVVAVRALLRMGIIITARYDIAVVHREALPFFTPLAERIVSRRSKRSLVDVDDAVYEQPTHGRDWRRWLRDPAGARTFPRLFDIVSVGSPVLFQESRGSGRIVDFPTCPPKFTSERRPVREILWTGSASTLVNLEHVLEQTLAACEESGYRLVVLGAGNIDRLPPHPSLLAETWTAAREEAYLVRASIGLMPLRDTAWDRGKAAYKALRYLTAGVPSLVSPVGLNSELAAEYPRAVHVSASEWGDDLRDLLRNIPSGAQFDADVESARRRYDPEVHVRRIAGLLREPNR
jgi:hypothetical protein